MVAALRHPMTGPLLRSVVRVPFDPFDVGFIADPYPTYRHLRETDPVHRSPLGAWLLTRYSEAVSVLRDLRFGHAYPPVARQSSRPNARLQGDMLLFKNPPDHTRLRRVVDRVIAPYLESTLRPRVEVLADELLDRVQESREMDVVRDLALPLPVGVIGELLGLPAEEALACQAWTRDLIGPLGLGATRDAFARRRAAGAEVLDYFNRLVHERRRLPGPDLVSALIQAQAEGAPLEESEIVSTCALLFGAGQETTVRLIGTGILALLRHPNDLGRLRADPSLIPMAVEELLRYESPTQMVGRTAREDVTLAGRRIRQGQLVYVVLGAANRDPAEFSEPDRLDLGRHPNRHLAFGGGVHSCPGQRLARIETEVAITRLLRRIPALRLGDKPPNWRREFGIRALESLPITW
jgi:pimeloyl-[acyl-carrier protein] synthase